jgi:DNA-binding response OmpR family regulator
MRILIVEDEEAIALPLKNGLERKNFAVDVAFDGEQGLRDAKINEYDCIVLDLNLPKIDGFEIARLLRQAANTVPILMLTARDLKKDIHAGFESGADDYLTKPFDFTELVYRINALIKRNHGSTHDLLVFGPISLDVNAVTVTLSGIPVSLNKKEFGILEYLLRKQGTVVTQEELLEHVWDMQIDGFSQTVRTNMKTLRKKIDPEKELIKTVKGYGYVIN